MRDEEADAIRITGTPDLEVTLKGTNSDLSTMAIAVDAISRMREAEPGLVTVTSLPIVSFW